MANQSADTTKGQSHSARYIPPPPSPITFGKKPKRRYHHGSLYLDNYTNNLGEKLSNALPGPEYCDVTLKAGHVAFKGHKIILAAYSAFLHETFLETPSEGAYLQLQLDGTSPVGLAAFVDFVYTGAFKVTERTVTDVLATARDYKVADLTSQCELYLLDEVKVNDTNFIRMFNIAKVFNLKKLAEMCEPFFTGINVHYDTYLKYIEFAKYRKSDQVFQKVFEYIIREHKRLLKAEGLLILLDNDDMNALLQVDRHEFYTDLPLVELLINWVEHRLEDRLRYMPQLFKLINLRIFDDDNLDHIAEMVLIKNDPDCLRLIEDTRSYLHTMERTAQIDGPFLLTVSPRNIELRAIKRSLSTSERNIMIMPRIPEDFREIPGNVTQRTPFVAVLDNKLFVFGLYWRGKEGSHRYHDAALSCHSYDPYRHQWRELSSLQGAQTGNKLVVSMGKIYSLAGMASISKDKLNQVEVYYPAQDTWRASTPLPYSVAGPLAAAASDGHIYVSFANAWHKQYQREFLRFNTSTATWLRRALVPPLQKYHDIGSCVGKVYMFGVCSKGPLSSGYLRADCYEPAVDQWTIVQTRRFGLFTNFQALRLKDRIYVVADYEDKKQNGPDSKKTGTFSFDPLVRDLLIERECRCFERDKGASALLFVPAKTLAQIQGSNY
ncbi:kelch-like protein 12 [Lineus longissimus]|uniref:kelch-like protein 12 n=1 Tax=Lineus longissimus TaxID=88925 RepID=UPI00315D8E2B